jgi:hypothetical protein
MRGRLPKPGHSTWRKAIVAFILALVLLLPRTHSSNEKAAIRNPAPVLFDRAPDGPSAPLSAQTVGAVGDGITDNADVFTIIFAKPSLALIIFRRAHTG